MPERLTVALTRMATDPDRSALLHEIFRTYCHQYRNTLNSLKMCLYLARRGGDNEFWHVLERNYSDVEIVLDRFQLLLRPISLNRVTLPIALLFDDRKATWAELLKARGRRLIFVEPEAPVLCSFDPLRLAQAFDNLVAWRSDAGPPDADLRLSWTCERGCLCLTWEEARYDEISPETRTPFESTSNSPLRSAVSFFALPTVSRIIHLHGGTVDEAKFNPWSVRISWPIDSTTA